MMKDCAKIIVKKSGLRGLSRYVRKIRKACYYLFDAIGYILFFPVFLISAGKKDAKGKINKILVIRIDRIGDVLLSTPAIRAVRETFPAAEISLLVSAYTKDLVVDSPDIDKLLIYGQDRVSSNYDLAFALHSGLRQNYLTFTSGARIRVGYTGWGGGFFLTRKLVDDREKRIRHEVESALEVVGSIGCTTQDKSLRISVTKEGEEFAEEYLQQHQFNKEDIIVVVHPGARQDYIRWEKRGFAAVADRLIKEEKAKVILIASRSEQQLMEEVVSLMREKPFFAIGLSLAQLVSLIKRCRLFIGNSTGPMHIAAALKVPVVAIFGNIHPLDSYQEWGPWGEGHIVVSRNLNCSDCHPSDCKTFDCLQLISAEEVLEAARQQLNIK